jgi:uncharacterized membrane protein YqaE (UPF0057 family)
MRYAWRYILALFPIPPLAVMTTGRIGSFIWNMVWFCLAGACPPLYFVAVVHAIMVVKGYQDTRQLLDDISETKRAALSAPRRKARSRRDDEYEEEPFQHKRRRR